MDGAVGVRIHPVTFFFELVIWKWLEWSWHTSIIRRVTWSSRCCSVSRKESTSTGIPVQKWCQQKRTSDHHFLNHSSPWPQCVWSSVFHNFTAKPVALDWKIVYWLTNCDPPPPSQLGWTRVDVIRTSTWTRPPLHLDNEWKHHSKPPAVFGTWQTAFFPLAFGFRFLKRWHTQEMERTLLRESRQMNCGGLARGRARTWCTAAKLGILKRGCAKQLAFRQFCGPWVSRTLISADRCWFVLHQVIS